MIPLHLKKVISLSALTLATQGFAANSVGVPAYGLNEKLDGELLFGELNCAACHTAKAAPKGKPAPLLTEVGSRVSPEYLKKFIADPHATKPGSTMPHLLHGLSDSERTEAAESLTHYLVSLSEPLKPTPSPAGKSVEEAGKFLYHTVGCVACHGAVDSTPPMKIPGGEEEGEPAKFSPHSGLTAPLGDLAAKTTVEQLAAFLLDPLKVRPGGRMPSLNLTNNEATSIATYLLRIQKKEGGKQIAPGIHFAYYPVKLDQVPEDVSNIEAIHTGVAEWIQREKVTGPQGVIPKDKPPQNFLLHFKGLLNIPKAGKYKFRFIGDDRYKVIINGKQVIPSEGRSKQECEIELSEGAQEIEAFSLQQKSQYDLRLEWNLPGNNRRQTVPAEAFSHRVETRVPHGWTEFKLDRKLVSRGRDLFTSMKCASCHQTGDSLASKTVSSLERLGVLSDGGCLSDFPSKSSMKYDLSETQLKSLRGIVESFINEDFKPADPAEMTLAQMNCYACHARDGKGGPSEAHNPYFTTLSLVDMGDEGRLPPTLDLAGAKFNHEGLNAVLLNGQRLRPNMATRMPSFGENAVGNLAKQLIEADKSKLPKHTPSTNARFVDVGRNLVGTKGLGCVNCHSWNGQNSLGVPGPDLITSVQRLEPAWFHKWLTSPQALRQGTRMPPFWPEGKSIRPDILKGHTTNQIDAIWAYLKAGASGGVPDGFSGGQTKMLVVQDEPITFRTFLSGVSAHAITVGMPEKVHFAFDANRVKMVQAWTGQFISASPAWDGRAGRYAPIPSKDIVQFPDGPTLAILEDAKAAWPTDIGKAKRGSSRTPEGWKYKGYRFNKKRIPTFFYEAPQGIKVEETPGTRKWSEIAYLSRTLKLAASKEVNNAYVRVATGQNIESKGSDFVVDGKYTYTVTTKPSMQPKLRKTENGQELLVPLKWAKNQADIKIELSW